MNQTAPALLELKNPINKMKNALESIRNRRDNMEDRICAPALTSHYLNRILTWKVTLGVYAEVLLRCSLWAEKSR